jgi:hypothetical protein
MRILSNLPHSTTSLQLTGSANLQYGVSSPSGHNPKFCLDERHQGLRVEMVVDTGYWLADTRQAVRIQLWMAAFSPKPGGYPGIPRDTWGQRPAGRVSFQPARYMYLVEWKGFLPASEVVPCRPFKGRVSKETRQRLRMAISLEKATGYPDAQGPSLLERVPRGLYWPGWAGLRSWHIAKLCWADPKLLAYWIIDTQPGSQYWPWCQKLNQ